MKKTAKRVLATVCAFVLVVGTGLSMIGQASNPNASAQQSEWIMFSGNKESIITDEGHLVVSVENAGVNIPKTLTKKDLGLSIKLTIPNEAALNSMKTGVVEIAQDICDVAELSWELSTQELKVGENVIELELTDGAATGGNVAFDVHQTINWFRIYSITNPNGNTITLQEVKLVDIREAGLEFGAKKTADTYLQLTDPLESTPQSIEASVKMTAPEAPETGWLLRAGSTVNTSSGHTMTTGVTVEGDKPGAGMTYSILDASKGAISGFSTYDGNLGIDAGEYELGDLAVAFWVYSNKAGTLGTGDQMRIGSGEYLSSDALIYYYSDIPVNAGWNYIAIPLDTWKTDIAGNFTVSDINCFGFTSYNLAAGEVRYFGDIRLVDVNEDAGTGSEGTEDTTDDTIKWTLRSGSDTSIWGNGSGHTLTTGTTVEGDAPGAGMKYTILNASSKAVTGFSTRNTDLGINASEYEMSELAVAFWVYADKAGKLGTGDQLRIGSGEYLGSDALIYYFSDVNLEAGWNYVQIPLDKWKTDIKGNFTLSNIRTFGFSGYQLAKGNVRYFGDFELIVIPPQTEWELRSGTDTTIWGISSGHTLTTGKTVAGDAPGAGISYAILDATSKAVSGFSTRNTGLGINVSEHAMSDLAVAFWVYADKAGKLGTGDQFRIGSADYLGSDALIYYFQDIQVSAGWNYIELPLDKWKTDIKGNFSLSNIKTFGFTGYNLAKGNVRYFGAFKLVVLQAEPITSVVLRAGSDTSTTSGHTIATGATVAGDKIGADKAYNILSDGSAALSGFGTMKTGLGINASASEMSDLAVAFWVYSNEAGKLGTGEQFRIGSGPYMGSNALIYYFQDISVEEGWNYIELPLDKWKTDIKQQFTLKNIDVFGYSNYSLAEGQVRYIADIQLINTKLVSVEMPDVYVDVTKNVTTVENNYMIFSNANAQDEKNTYALFITEEGYPSLLYGTTQFTLTQDVRTGEWVDIAAVRDGDGFITFYIDGKVAARSDVPVKEIGAPDTAHCIGADGAGAQIMAGYIADVRVWSDVRSAEEIKDNLVEKEVGVLDNGLSADTEDLMGSWFLLGDIQDVLETLPDTSANENTAVYRGSRADDWIDYEIPEEIGEDYWSVVFVPDIQMLIQTADYNKTWVAMSEWIADNIETENIQHVIGAGDNTNGNTAEEYNRAMEGFEKFNDLVPTSVIIGNHDYVWGIPNRDSAVYQSYFGEDDILTTAASNTYVGYFDDPEGLSTTENSYYRFSVNGTKWMILQLEYHPRVSALEWAQSILQSHPDDNVIFVTHSYLDPYGDYANNTNMTYISEDDTVGGSIGGTTEAIWKDYLSDYTNIKMILCGHSHNRTGAVMTRTEINAEGEEVPVMMINAQDMDYDAGVNDKTAYYDYKPIGMLGILRFSADGTNVALQYYAPTSEKSFSPEDPFGNADSNNLMYTFSVEVCSHTNTILKVNDDKATGSTNGYTGDTYCTDCQTMVSTGEIIPATGKIQGTEQGTGKTENTGKDESPKTGDASNPILWVGILAGSVLVTYLIRTKYRKEEE